MKIQKTNADKYQLLPVWSIVNRIVGLQLLKAQPSALRNSLEQIGPAVYLDEIPAYFPANNPAGIAIPSLRPCA